MGLLWFLSFLHSTFFGDKVKQKVMDISGAIDWQSQLTRVGGEKESYSPPAGSCIFRLPS